MATRIAPDGTETPITPANGKSFTLAELYQHVECSSVEVVYLSDGRLMWVDEDGKHRPDRRPENNKATNLLHRAGGVPWDVVLGPVLITTYQEGG